MLCKRKALGSKPTEYTNQQIWFCKVIPRRLKNLCTTFITAQLSPRYRAELCTITTLANLLLCVVRSDNNENLSLEEIDDTFPGDCFPLSVKEQGG